MRWLAATFIASPLALSRVQPNAAVAGKEQVRREVSEPAAVSFYAARVSDLSTGDLVLVECVCGHTEAADRSGVEPGRRGTGREGSGLRKPNALSRM
jgi:hypothetical protein